MLTLDVSVQLSRAKSFMPVVLVSRPFSTPPGAEMNLARYKYVVQVVIGEQRGEGVRMGSRCFWDSETDNVASETYINVR